PLGTMLARAPHTFPNMPNSPRRRLREIDNRGSHFYLATYWAQELSKQTQDAALAESFAQIAYDLVANEEVINSELLGAQGQQVDIGGYYYPDDEQTSQVMRPSPTLNRIIDSLKS